MRVRQGFVSARVNKGFCSVPTESHERSELISLDSITFRRRLDRPLILARSTLWHIESSEQLAHGMRVPASVKFLAEMMVAEALRHIIKQVRREASGHEQLSHPPRDYRGSGVRYRRICATPPDDFNTTGSDLFTRRLRTFA
jgi:hypothetical protein